MSIFDVLDDGARRVGDWIGDSPSKMTFVFCGSVIAGTCVVVFGVMGVAAALGVQS